MASAEVEDTKKKMRKYYCDFIIGLSTRLLDIVDNNKSSYNTTPELNRISQAILTLSYIYRVKHRHSYFILRSKIIKSKKFFDFCKKNFQREKLPYFLTFLLHVSEKFELFLYVREEGYNYFSIFLKAMSDYPDFMKFVMLGGAEKCSEICMHLLDLTEQMQILVNTENPCRKKLLTLEESIYEIETRYFALSRDKSFACLRKISKHLYSGLQKYASEPVLPFIILRFLLDGKVPQLEDDKKKSVTFEDSKYFFVKYFSRCLGSDIINGESYKGKTRKEVRVSLGIQESYENHTNLKSYSSENKSNKITIKEWLPILNPLMDDKVKEVGSNTDVVSPKEGKTNQKKGKEFSESLSTIETVTSNLESFRHFKARPVLNTDHLTLCPKCHGVGDNSSKNNNPLSEIAASSSSKDLGARQKECFSDNPSSEKRYFEIITLKLLSALVNK